jgi:hypothetical protein
MNHTHSSARFAIFALTILVATPLLRAQQQASVVPTLVNFSGVLTDANGKPLTGTVGATFFLYKDQQGGAPLWLETQNVQADKSGHYSVMLGSAGGHGLPPELFASGEARWLGVQAQGQAEQPRVMLLAVPYALKAGDAQTIGGLPASAFVLATPVAPTGTAAANSESTSNSNPAPPAGNVTGSGTVNFLPIWTGTSTIGNSVLFQAGTGAKAKLGIGTTKPASTLDVKGGGTIRGLFSLPATGTATASAGFKSQPMNLVTSVFNSGTSTAVPQTFQWQTEPVGNNTTNATGSLNLLFGRGTIKPAETGLNVASNGQIKFATGQTFPGTGTVTSVGLSAPASDLTVSGSPVTGTGTLNLAWNVAPTNADTANAIVKRDASGNFSAGTITASALNAVNASLSNSLGIVSGSGTPAYVQSSAGGATSVWGAATATTGQGWGVYGVTSSGDSGAYGVYGLANSGAAIGVKGYSSSSQGVWGESTGTVFSNGVGSDGVHGVSHSTAGSGVAGVNDAQDATGVYGSDPSGYGFVTDSHVSQARGAGGWAKAMAYVDPYKGGIQRCFNSQLAGSQATTVPCGMSYTYVAAGEYIIDFGFQVDDRFVQATSYAGSAPVGACLDDYCGNTYGIGPNQVVLLTNGSDTPMYVTVF